MELFRYVFLIARKDEDRSIRKRRGVERFRRVIDAEGILEFF